MFGICHVMAQLKVSNDVCLSDPLRNQIMRMIKLAVHHHSVCLVSNLVKLCYRYADATFRVVKAPFTQLFGVHAFVKSGSCVKQVPFYPVFMQVVKYLYRINVTFDNF